MAELSILSRLSESSRTTLDWAQAYAEARHSPQIEALDLWAGVMNMHADDSPPLVILAHFDIPLKDFTFLLRLDPLGTLAPYKGQAIPLESMAPESMKTLELAVSLGEQFNTLEGGLVRLRDLFGALLLMPSTPLRSFQQVLEEAAIPSEEVTQAYQEFLGMPEASLREFLQERFPPAIYGAGNRATPVIEGEFDPSQAVPGKTAPLEQLKDVEGGTLTEPESPDRQSSASAGGQERPDDSTIPPLQKAVSGFSADTRSQKDLVGIGAEVDAFAYLISARELRPPLAVGLFGDWGSGKTYFMQSLKERIFKITDDARKSGSPQKDLSVYKYIVQIEFNAWHYVEGELWASLVENILHNLQTRAGESPSLLQQRQQKLIEEMDQKRRRQSLANEQKNLLENVLVEKQGEIESLKQEQAGVLNQLEQLRTVDVIQAIELSPQEREELGEVLQEMGVSRALHSAMDFMEALEGLKGELERGSALAVVLRRRGWSWSLGIAGVILAGPLASLAISLLGGEGVPAVTNAVLSFSATLSGLTLLLRAGTKEAASLRGRVEAAQERLEARRLEEEARFAAQIEALEAELKEKTQEYQDALAQELELEEQIEALEAELSQVTPRKVLLDFIKERVESQDYRKWLGVPALIRRDFSQLSELLQEQNQTFVESDDGEERNPDQINRIVLYIDDLDRCPPRRVTEVLQAVHLLLAFPLFVVVVAVDSRWLSQSLQSHYGALLGQDNGYGSLRASPQDYLEKIFQIPFWVSPLGDQARLRILQGLVAGSLTETARGGAGAPGEEFPPAAPLEAPGEQGSLESAAEPPQTEPISLSNLQWTPAETARQYDPQAQTDPNPPGLEIEDLELAFMQDLRGLLGETPRSVKRFVNVYWLVKSMALGQAEDFVSEQPLADFKMVQFLLATLTGLPSLAHELFALLLSDQGPQKGGGKVGIQKAELALGPGDGMAACVEVLRNRLTRRRSGGESVDSALGELERLKSWLESYQDGSWLELPAAQLKAWAPLAARFSYRMED
jgi:hypothetical protein